MEILNAIALALTLFTALGSAATLATKVRDAIPTAQVEAAAPAPQHEDCPAE